MSGASYCSWEGVVCDELRRVIGLYIGTCHPPPWGTAPYWIDGCQTHDSPSLIGPIPQSLGNLTSLKRLQLAGSSNPFIGAQLTGTFPTSLSRLASLTFLYVEDIGPFNPLPNLDLLMNLQTLYIRDSWYQTGFAGTLPALSTTLTSLFLFGTLDHNYNAISSPIPLAWGNLSQLANLQMGMLGGLSGSLPSTFSMLASLQTLVLKQMPQLSGVLPTLPSNLTNITISGTALSGPLTTAQCPALNQAATCILTQNNFSCPLPACLRNLACNPNSCLLSGSG
jgi:hypothetical protein